MICEEVHIIVKLYIDEAPCIQQLSCDVELPVQIVFVPVALACYASMVSHSWMPKTAFVSSSQPGELPAQLEVLVASLFTISSWRGIYAGLRTYI